MHLLPFLKLSLFIVPITATLIASATPARADFEITEVAAQNEDAYRNSESDSILFPDSTLLLAYTRFYPDPNRANVDDNGAANIVLKHSKDGGKTWSEPKDLELPQGRINNMQVSFLQTKTGAVQLYYSKRNAGDKADKWVIESWDKGQTWNQPRQITPGDNCYTGPNDRIIRLSTGRIINPCHIPIKINGREEYAPVMLYSDDEGTTWQAGEPVRAEQEFYTLKEALKMHEPTVIQRGDGSLWMLARTAIGCFFEATSTDEGKTWGTATPTNIESETAPPQMKRLADGRLLLAWNPQSPDIQAHVQKLRRYNPSIFYINVPFQKRTKLVAATSRDDGKTWSKPITLADGGKEWGYCYPAIQEIGQDLLIFVSKTPNIIYPCSLTQIRVPLSKLP